MSVEMACYCGDLPAHSHVYEHLPYEDERGVGHMASVPSGEVRIWVDWKQVARELAIGPRSEIDRLTETLTRPRRHDNCDTEHAPGECLVHDKRARNCRYDDVPRDLRFIDENRCCEPCLREQRKR